MLHGILNYKRILEGNIPFYTTLQGRQGERTCGKVFLYHNMKIQWRTLQDNYIISY